MELNRNYYRFAWGVLVYNLAVILWGAFVRATGSGAGCGSHWPLCNGQVIPQARQIETLIEFTHRLMSGLALLLVVALLVWAYRAYPKHHPVRLGASLSMGFMLTEALVGAGLVLFEWVAKDASLGRVISISVHLVNTFLLLAALSLTAWWASGGERVQLRGQGLLAWGFTVAFLGFLFIGISGAITALGDTLFPPSSLAEGLSQDFSPTANFLVRLRVWHPSIAIAVGFYLLFFVFLLGMLFPDPRRKWLAGGLGALFLLQLGAGLINVVLLAPIWMQLIHLFLADVAWISLVLFCAATLVRRDCYAGRTRARSC